MKVGSAIKDCRLRARLSQQELARKAKLTQGYLSNVELNRQVPSQKMLTRISKVLKVPPAVFMIMGIEKKDIKYGKKTLYAKLRPAINGLIEIALNQTYGK